MKTVKNTLGKVMIAIATMFFLGLAVAGSGSAHAQSSDETAPYCGVSDADVVKYLNDHGYRVLSLGVVSGCCDRIATTQNTYQTRVYVVDSRIVDHEDIPN